MYYYLIAVGSHTYHGQEPLTYSSPEKLSSGELVSISLQNRSIVGFVVSETTKPKFKTKPIHNALSVSLPLQYIALWDWLRTFYPSPLGVSTQLFLPKSLGKKIPDLTITSTSKNKSASHTESLPTLTKEQSATLKDIQRHRVTLLHGETGSGKTRVYIEAARAALQTNSSAIILTPEIGLTPQLVDTFSQVFTQDQLIVIHSRLGAAARRNIWLKIAQNPDKNFVIIGARSAVFSPISRLGLIVVDESHEFAYKQESLPYYHTSRVASKLSELHDAKLIFGSATPSVTEYYMATAKGGHIARMSEKTKETTPVGVRVIDMRQLAEKTRSSHLSLTLLSAIENALSKKLQSLVFINRRGTARVILCESCGWQAVCPTCDLPLTYHHDSHKLQCHTCGFYEHAKSFCPECNNSDITLKSVGTKSIVSELEKLFPGAKVGRFDSDNTKEERIEQQFKNIHSGDIDILVGTQLITKGLDLPKLATVGVINADASLYIPDFSASERTYQLLHQIIGRVGRNSVPGTAIIQTYSPDNPTIRAAANQDWQLFYSSEMEERHAFLFPPFCHLLKVTCTRASQKSAIQSTENLATTLREQGLAIVIEGPAPAFHERIQGKYTWHLVIKSKQRSELLKVITRLPSGWSYDIDPISLL